VARRAGEPVDVEGAATPHAAGSRRRADRSAGLADGPPVNADLQRENERLERANAELWRENERLARATLGQSDAAAAAQLRRSERNLGPRLGDAEARIEHLERLLATPRHQAVEHLRDIAMRFGPLYWLVHRVWALFKSA
jgi:predicted RNase H-like nuclease (RuvC/YqgF family)